MSDNQGKALRVTIDVFGTTVEVVRALDRKVGEIGQQYNLPLNDFFVDLRAERPSFTGRFDIFYLSAEEAAKKGEEICQQLKELAKSASNVAVNFQYGQF